MSRIIIDTNDLGVDEVQAMNMPLKDVVDLSKKKEEEKRLKLEAKERERQQKEYERARKKASSKTTAIDKVANSAMSAIGREVGRSLIRGVLGTFKR